AIIRIAITQAIRGDNVPAINLRSEAHTTSQTHLKDFFRPCRNIRGEGNKARERSFNNRINDSYSTFSRYVSLIKGETHTTEVVEGDNTITICRNNLMGEAIHIVRIRGRHCQRDGFKETGFKLFLKSTGLFDGT